MESPERESEELLRPGDVRRLYGVAASTLRMWAATGVLNAAQRTAGGHRRYRASDVAALKAALSTATEAPVKVAA